MKVEFLWYNPFYTNKHERFTMTKNELKAKVKELLGNAYRDIINDFFNSEISGGSTLYDSEEVTEFKTKLAALDITFDNVEQFGGEGEGEKFYSVYSFSTQNEVIFVKFNGYYQSYDGSTYLEWFFVEPKEKMITVYE